VVFVLEGFAPVVVIRFRTIFWPDESFELCKGAVAMEACFRPDFPEAGLSVPE